jgi:hypothetical protein
MSTATMEAPPARTGADELWLKLLADLEPPEDLLPSEWAERHILVTDGERVGPLSFGRGYEYQREPLNTFFGPFEPGESLRRGVAYKGAQSGITLLCLIGLMYQAAVRGTSAAHMMPRQFDSDDKAKKLDAMISASEHLSATFPPGLLRVRHTRGGQQLRVCYSNSKNELKSWQMGAGVVDEPDDCEHRDYDSISMFWQRMGSYRRQLQLVIGTPTIPDFGIHARWEESDQRQWHIRCPLCDFEQVLDFERNITFTEKDEQGVPLSDEDASESARMVCASCREPWDFRLRERANATGVWRATKESPMIGFGMNRLMVPTSLPAQMVTNFLKGKRSELAMREHYNQDRGQARLHTTGKLHEELIRLAFDPKLTWWAQPKGTIYMAVGVDVQGEAEPFDYVWELRAYDARGVASVIAYGIDKEERLLQLFGTKTERGLKMLPVSRMLLDITSGHHKAAVNRIVAQCPIAEAVRCDWHRKTSFRAGEVVKIKKGGSKGYAIDEDAALEENISRFFALDKTEGGRRIRFALCPNAGLQATLVEHYTKIARVQEKGPDGKEVFRYRKLRPRDVDFPYAGAFADYAFSQLGGNSVGKGAYGPAEKVQQAAKARGVQAQVRQALRVVRRKR